MIDAAGHFLIGDSPVVPQRPENTVGEGAAVGRKSGRQ